MGGGDGMRILDRRNLDRRHAMKMLDAAGATATVSGCLDSGQGKVPDEGGNSDGGDEDGSRRGSHPTWTPSRPWTGTNHDRDIQMTGSNYVAEMEPGVTFEFITLEHQVPNR